MNAHLRQPRRPAVKGEDLARLRGRNPMALFQLWMNDAKRADTINPDAAVLATVARDGMPQARNVLVKQHDRAGFVFFTNRDSRKGKALRAKAKAALAFYWKPLGRQVLVEGEARELTRAQTRAYFITRPRASQIGAWASMQSQPISDYALLADAAAKVEQKYRGKNIPLPPHWGGFRLRPLRVEFWREGKARLHQRLVFQRGARGWQTSLLQP